MDQIIRSAMHKLGHLNLFRPVPHDRDTSSAAAPPPDRRQGKGTTLLFLRQARNPSDEVRNRSALSPDWEGCSATTGVPHGYFDQAG